MKMSDHQSITIKPHEILYESHVNPIKAHSDQDPQLPQLKKSTVRRAAGVDFQTAAWITTVLCGSAGSEMGQLV